MSETKNVYKVNERVHILVMPMGKRAAKHLMRIPGVVKSVSSSGRFYRCEYASRYTKTKRTSGWYIDDELEKREEND